MAMDRTALKLARSPMPIKPPPSVKAPPKKKDKPPRKRLFRV
jgi:hypothetical protein